MDAIIIGVAQAAVLKALHEFVGKNDFFHFESLGGYTIFGYPAADIEPLQARSAVAVNLALRRIRKDFPALEARANTYVFKVIAEPFGSHYVLYSKVTGVMYIYATKEDILVRR